MRTICIKRLYQQIASLQRKLMGKITQAENNTAYHTISSYNLTSQTEPLSKNQIKIQPHQQKKEMYSFTWTTCANNAYNNTEGAASKSKSSLWCDITLLNDGVIIHLMAI